VPPDSIYSTAILSPEELSRLEQLRLSPRRRFAGRMRGERMSRQKGISLEFADYRDYTVGDDLRHLDWNILARLDRATIRTYQDEDDLAIYILLDTSASMDFGKPTKFVAAKKLAVSLGFIGLCGQDLVTPIAYGRPGGRSLRGRGSLNSLERWATAAEPSGSQSFSSGINAFVKSRGARPGMVICITDALDEDAAAALRSIAARGHELLLIQVLSIFDIDPELEGDLKLIDSELGHAIDITAHSETIHKYKQNLARHCRAVEQATGLAGGRYLRVDSSVSPIEVISRELRSIGAIV